MSKNMVETFEKWFESIHKTDFDICNEVHFEIYVAYLTGFKECMRWQSEE